MARMHTSRRGRSGSRRPLSKVPPPWLKYTPEEVEALVVKLAKEGLTPSKIGVVLRDTYGIPLVKSVCGETITQILEENNLRPVIPEDLSSLIERIRRMRVHIQKFKSDRYNVHRLQLVESKARRLVNYYKRKGLLQPEFDPIKI